MKHTYSMASNMCRSSHPGNSVSPERGLGPLPCLKWKVLAGGEMYIDMLTYSVNIDILHNNNIITIILYIYIFILYIYIHMIYIYVIYIYMIYIYI